MSDTPQAPAFYCPQCGERFQGPGVCQNLHPPAELRLVADDEPQPEVAATPPVVLAPPTVAPPLVAPPLAAEPAPVAAPAPALSDKVALTADEGAAPDVAAPSTSPLERARQLVSQLGDLLAEL